MSVVLAVGSGVGFVLGVVHAAGVFAQRLREAAVGGVWAGSGVGLRAAYGAIWTVALWTVFGSYILVLWLISLPLWLGHRVVRSRRLSGAEA